MNLPNLLLFHIGPVQSFIVSARRSRDLWFGSWLLSDLSKTAARVIAQRHGKDSLIFPAPLEDDDLLPDSDLIVANKILAYIDGDLGDTPREVDEEVRKRLRHVAGQAFDIPGTDGSRYFDRGAAEAQIDDLPEIYWVSLPCKNPSDYHRQRDALEALMSARKNTRQFSQPTKWSATKAKSSLDGQRESVIDEKLYERAAKDGEAGVLNSDRLYRLFRARRAERLSGVDMMKRLGNPGPGATFPSTSHVAALPVIHRLRRKANEDRRIADWAKAYVQQLKKYVSAEFVEPLSGRFAVPELDGHDGSILFESRLWEDDKLTDEGKRDVQSALAAFLKDALGTEKSPSPYYMVLQGDGDRMGVVIDAMTDPNEQRRFSQALSAFSLNVRAVVEDRFGGALVYAGGDDVLAFLPLDTGLACAHTIAELFRRKMRRFADKSGTHPTFSAGLVIAHHLESLAQTMELARSAEKAAKGVEGKDAIAITLSKRSGADRTIAGHWGSLVPRLEDLIQLVRDDEIPAGAAYDLRNLTIRLDATNNGALLEIHEKEIDRILHRKRSQHGAKPLQGKDSVVETLLAHVTPVAADTVRQFADTLVIADLLADAQTMSGTSRAELAEMQVSALRESELQESGSITEGAGHE